MSNTAHAVVVPPGDGEDLSYLALLARVKVALESATELSVPASELRPYPDQPRQYFDEAHISGLSASIDSGGQTTPGIIRKKPAETLYEIIDGECRWRGILRIPEERRPLYRARLVAADDEVVQYLISGIANFNRKGHTAIEIMDTIDRLRSFKLPMTEIANLLGINIQWAYQMHGLKKLVPEVLAMLSPELPKDKQLPVTAAIQISKIDGRLQLGLAQRVLNKDVSLAQLRAEVVKVGRRAGVPVRVQEVKPLHQWDSFNNKIYASSRALDDALALIIKGSFNSILATRPADARQLAQKLRAISNTALHVEERMNKIRTSR